MKINKWRNECVPITLSSMSSVDFCKHVFVSPKWNPLTKAICFICGWIHNLGVIEIHTSRCWLRLCRWKLSDLKNVLVKKWRCKKNQQNLWKYISITRLVVFWLVFWRLNEVMLLHQKHDQIQRPVKVTFYGLHVILCKIQENRWWPRQSLTFSNREDPNWIYSPLRDCSI